MRSDPVPPDAESSAALDLVEPAHRQEPGSTVRRYIIWSYQHAVGAPSTKPPSCQRRMAQR
ncbi:hypothetical protein ACFWJU_29625 [Streptomyces mutabilis]|uniref:hypothetical protein n=1 Tax=Streptomyces mutabilis TaxID=67332 RepID=UPI00364DC3BB